LWLHSLKVAQLLRSAACLHTNQSRSYLNHLVNAEFNWKHLQTVGCWLKGGMAGSTQDVTRGEDKGKPKLCSLAMKLSCLLPSQDNRLDPVVETN